MQNLSSQLLHLPLIVLAKRIHMCTRLVVQLEAITLQPAELYSAVLRARQWGKVTVEHVGGMLKWSLHFFSISEPKGFE